MWELVTRIFINRGLVVFAALMGVTSFAAGTSSSQAVSKSKTAPKTAVKTPAGLRKTIKLVKVEFEAPVNLKALNVKGEAQSLEGYAVTDEKSIQEIMIKVPVESLTTKMTLRDQHMRERIFQTKDGKLPPLILTGTAQACEPAGAERICNLEGQLEIQGTRRPFKPKILIAKTDKGYKASSDATVKLSDYGIPQPTQLGVKVEDVVKLHLEVLAE